MAQVMSLGADRHGSPRWFVRYWTPDGARRSKTFRSMKQADDFAREVEMDKRRGVWTDPRLARTTLEEYWEAWRKRAEELARPRASTLQKYDCVWWLYVEPALGAKQLGAIRRADVADMVTAVSERVSRWQAAEALKLARMLLNRAVDDEIISVSRASLVGALAIERRRPKVLTPEELGRLIEATADRRRALVVLNAWAPLRWSEIVALSPDAVDFLRRQVRIERAAVEINGRPIIAPTKTKGSRRTVPLPAFVVEALAEHVRRFAPVETELGSLMFTS